MRIHHLNCHAVRGFASHCLLVESPVGLVLIDTGFGLRDVLDPRHRLSRTYLTIMRPRLRTEMTAVRQVRRLGFDPSDVGHIILSHLDCDRVGGLDDFPRATVHVHREEVRAAMAQATALDRIRYRGQQWASRHRWRTYPTGGDTLWGFSGVRRLDGIPPEILLVPLPGHTAGHCGVAVRGTRGWLFYAGDAYVTRDELDPVRPACSAGLRFYQWMLARDRRARAATVRKLRALANGGAAVDVFCAHDPLELMQMRQTAPDGPFDSMIGQLGLTSRVVPPGLERRESGDGVDVRLAGGV